MGIPIFFSLHGNFEIIKASKIRILPINIRRENFSLIIIIPERAPNNDSRLKIMEVCVEGVIFCDTFCMRKAKILQKLPD